MDESIEEWREARSPVRPAAAGVKVRDKRRPGHCWQDNELYDAWQPIVGPHAVNVYVNLTRDAYASTIEYSVRKLADATGISKSAVWRNLKVMEHVGMLRLETGAGSAGSVCELLDLKEAAEKLGAVYNRQRASFLFTDMAVARLRAGVTEMRRRMQEKQPKPEPVEMDPHVVMGPEMIDPFFRCVPDRDTNSEEKAAEEKNLCPSSRDTSVPLEGGLCPFDGGSQQKCEQNTIHNTNPPPTPALPAGVLAARADALRAKAKTPGADGGDHVDDALEYLMRECGFCDERLKKVLREVLVLRMQRIGAAAYDVAEEMISAWGEYLRIAEWLRFQWSPANFFKRAYWLNPRAWPLDQARWEQAKNAAVGAHWR